MSLGMKLSKQIRIDFAMVGMLYETATLTALELSEDAPNLMLLIIALSAPVVFGTLLAFELRSIGKSATEPINQPPMDPLMAWIHTIFEEE